MDSIAKEWIHLMNNSCDTPTLFIRGKQSDYIKEDDKQVIKAMFSNSEIAELDAEHWVHYERPDEFIKVTVDFLNPQ